MQPNSTPMIEAARAALARIGEMHEDSKFLASVPRYKNHLRNVAPSLIALVEALLAERGAFASAEPFEDSPAEEWEAWHEKRKIVDAALSRFVEESGKP